MSGNEYSSYGRGVLSLSYTTDELYFVVPVLDADGYLTAFNYCKKDLNTNKITIYQKVDLDVPVYE